MAWYEGAPILLGLLPAKLITASPPHVTRLEPRRITRRPALLPFWRVLRGPRTLGIGVAHGGRAGKDLSPGTDSGRRCFSPFSAWQLRRNHFFVAIGVARAGWICAKFCKHRRRAALHDNPPVARTPRNGLAVSPTASAPPPTPGKRITSLRVRFSVAAVDGGRSRTLRCEEREHFK